MAKQTNAERKAERERQIFGEFCTVAGISVDAGSIVSDVPPNADIRCTIHGKLLFCEMGEVTDESLASAVAKSIRTGEVTGGAFSQDEPLRDLFEEKSHHHHAVKDAEVHFLAYYDKQYPLHYDPTFIPDTVGEIAAKMVDSGQWQRIWVYDTWEKRILWSFP